MTDNPSSGLNLAEELRNAGRPMNPNQRIYNVLSKGGKVQFKDCNPISQATWSAWERGYKQAIEDVKNNLIDIDSSVWGANF